MDLSNLILMATEAVTHNAEEAGLLGTLGINAKLFIAQLINFAVVLFILWKWVFNPIGGTLEKRRKKIEESLNQAQIIEERMKQFEIEREQKILEAKKEADALARQTLISAERIRNDHIEKAKSESENLLAGTRQKIKAEKEQAMAEIREDIAEITTIAVQKIIQEKLDGKKDQDLLRKAISQGIKK